MAFGKSNDESDLDGKLATIEEGFKKIKEINAYIENLDMKISMYSDGDNIENYVRARLEFENEKYMNASGFRDVFEEIEKYDGDLRQKAEELRCEIATKQVMAQVIQEENLNPDRSKEIEKEIQAKQNELIGLTSKLEKTSPVLETVKSLLNEIDEEHKLFSELTAT